jgi:hypothetical protein
VIGQFIAGLTGRIVRHLDRNFSDDVQLASAGIEFAMREDVIELFVLAGLCAVGTLVAISTGSTKVTLSKAIAGTVFLIFAINTPNQ